MKVKEIDRTANVAWSPQAQVPVYLAAGTAAQQLDASFSTNSNLEIYSLNLSESGHEMPCVASLPVEQRYHKVVWGGAGMSDGTMPSGLLVGGADRGVLSMYDAAKLVGGGEEPLVFSQDKHTGPVAALDFNPFQSNLLASGASESELFIWDVNKLGSPMSPGAKSQPLDDVKCVSWNRQVQHILASTFATRCVVWDLRKNDPIIKVSDSTGRMRCRVVGWHPAVATQLCLASEDDHSPVIQIWDLRLASSPLKTLEGHHKGVLSVAWCQADPDLLLSCGKDNRLLVWNPNSTAGEIVAELPTSNQWSFDVSWCPRNPALIASASFDGRVSLYSLMGGQQQVEPNTRVSDSFGPGLGAVPCSAPPAPCQLATPPKWLRRPCGANFGFGGKLVSWETEAGKPGVFISRVVTEPELVAASEKLETSVAAGNYTEFCTAKLAGLEDEDQARVWRFIQASFQPQPEQQFLALLGINAADIKLKTAELAGESAKVDTTMGDEFEMIAAVAAETEAEEEAVRTALDQEFQLSREENLTAALLAGDVELAVQLAVKQGRFAEALILSLRGAPGLLEKTRAQYFQQAAREAGEAQAGLALVEAVAMQGWDKLVQHCSLVSWREVLAALLTYTDSAARPGLAGRLADRLTGAGQLVEGVLCHLVAGSLDRVAACWPGLAPAAPLQDLVEVAVLARAAVEARGLPSVGPSGELAAALAQYAGLLAGQGSLHTALAYLGDSGDKELTERLQRAVARPAQHQQPTTASRSGPVSRTSSGPGLAGLGNSHRQSEEPPRKFSTGLPGQPSLSSAPAPAPVPAPAPPANMQYMQPAAVPAFQPPPGPDPALAAPAPSNPLMRGRRALDPTLSTPAPGQYGQYGQPYQPAAPQPAMFTPEPAPAPNMFTPSVGVTAPAPGVGSPRIPDQPGEGWAPPTSSGAGWNDPPALVRRPVTSPPSSVSAPAPLTTPLTGAQEPVPAPPAWQGFQPAPAGPVAPPSYQGFQPAEPAPVAVSQPGTMTGYQGFQPAEPAPPAAPAPAPEPAPPAPIPAEHQVIQDTLESLRGRCQQAATHPQVRRKLDDVAAKLDILYNKLRQSVLSAATLQGLHTILQHVWQYDYPACMQVISGLIAGGSFAEMSDFMPGVKVLLQVAQQQGVYVEYQQQ